MLNRTRANILLKKIFIVKIQINIVLRDKYCKFKQKRKKQIMLRKKIILKGYITTTKITQPLNFEKQHH